MNQSLLSTTRAVVQPAPVTLFHYTARDTNPYRNIARETFMLQHLPPDSGIFYLWQNQKTVVIGRNQNAWKECRISELEKDGGSLARRLSGGGAVFHDLGNLCFTFVFPNTVYDVPRQTGVLLDALQNLDIPAMMTGRNDLEIDGKKFSGHAYHTGKSASLHHGTFLVDADLQMAAAYLSPPEEKIAAKGVASVRSRIVNLAAIDRRITISRLSTALFESASAAYGPLSELPESFFDEAELARLETHFAAPEWKYGESPRCSVEVSRRFPWGFVEACFDVKDGLVSGLCLFSDAMDEACIRGIPARFNGQPFLSSDALLSTVDALYRNMLQ
jgi:lipoate-protein ligase A